MIWRWLYYINIKYECLREECSIKYILLEFRRYTIRNKIKLHWNDSLMVNSVNLSDAYCVCKRTIGAANGLSPGWRQVIIWTNAGMVLTGLLGTNFGETLIETSIFSFKKMHLSFAFFLSQLQCVENWRDGLGMNPTVSCFDRWWHANCFFVTTPVMEMYCWIGAYHFMGIAVYK